MTIEELRKLIVDKLLKAKAEWSTLPYPVAKGRVSYLNGCMFVLYELLDAIDAK